MTEEPGRLRVFFVVQPTAAHYREPLLRHLKASERLDVDLHGRLTNTEVTSAEEIRAASDDVLSRVTPIDFRTVGELWWEKGQVSAVWRGSHDVYVLAGRIYTLSAWAALAVGRLRGRTVLLWGHGWKRPETGLKRLLRLGLYAMCDGLLVYGDRAVELGMSYGVPKEKFGVVYNSIYAEADTGEITPTGEETEPHRPMVLYSARLTARHRLDTLAEALAEMTDPPHAVIIGDGDERPRLERRFTELGVEADFLGPVYDYHRLRELYGRTDAAVSIGGAGLNVIQAMSFGVPVIAEADHPDSSPEIEAVHEGESGRFFAHADPTGLARVLREALADRSGLRRMGRRGLEIVRRRYTAERHAEAVEASILRLAAQARTRRRWTGRRRTARRRGRITSRR
ncbi:glycosyltransferase family 4 protein [Nesterenkonia marinintestina]|uniref:glycosyltransferase family 4 protein n=1 Tax=Nesterenkonia marinintestina TaxID=2979865 RepID=UPI0021C0F319|nr:glycosyltransferase family 4 protein [Nesterenkonia sp. GX14115]